MVLGKNNRYLIKLVLVFFALTSCGQKNAELDEELNSIASQNQLVGMSVIVTKNNEVNYSYYYGKRDIARDLPVNENTKYRVASISKMVAATALMQLVEQELCDLSDDVNDYLDFTLQNPSFPDQTITLGSILSHTSSLRDFSGYHSFLTSCSYVDVPCDISELLSADGEYYGSTLFDAQYGPENNYFKYANVNFGIAGTLVEIISGERFDVYCRDQVLLPLGITGSFNIYDLPDINDLAVLYRKSGNNWIPQKDNYNGELPEEPDYNEYQIGSNGLVFSPQGGVRMSAEDLAKFMLMHTANGTYNGVTILQEATVHLMHDVVWEYNGSNGNNTYGIFNTYALGNHTTYDLLAGEELIGHPGEAYGLISDMYFSKVGDFGIIFITSGGVFSFGDSGWYSVEEDVFEACFNHLIEETRALALTNEKNYFEIIDGTLKFNFTEKQSENLRLTIFDVSGRTLIDQLISPNQSNFGLSELVNNQLYLVKLSNIEDDIYYTGKIFLLD